MWVVGAPVSPTRDLDSGSPLPWMVAAEQRYINQFIKQNTEFAIAIYHAWKGLLNNAKTENLISAQENILLANLLTLLGWLTVEREKSVPLLTSIRTTINQFLGEEESPPDRLLLDSQLQLLDKWIASLLKCAKDQLT